MSFLAIALFLVAHVATAQNKDTQPRFGVKGGLNLANLYINDVNDEQAKWGLHAGIWAKAPIGEYFAIQPELIWSSKGTRLASYNNIPFTPDGEIRFNLNYVDLPVLASLTLGPISLQAGPYVSYLVNANVKNLKEDLTSGTTVDLSRNDFNSFDYGLAGGIALDIKGFQLGARYNHGLREIGKSDLAGRLTSDSKNAVVQVFVAVGF